MHAITHTFSFFRLVIHDGLQTDILYLVYHDKFRTLKNKPNPIHLQWILWCGADDRLKYFNFRLPRLVSALQSIDALSA